MSTSNLNYKQRLLMNEINNCALHSNISNRFSNTHRQWSPLVYFFNCLRERSHYPKPILLKSSRLINWSTNRSTSKAGSLSYHHSLRLHFLTLCLGFFAHVTLRWSVMWQWKKKQLIKLKTRFISWGVFLLFRREQVSERWSVKLDSSLGTFF